MEVIFDIMVQVVLHKYREFFFEINGQNLFNVLTRNCDDHTKNFAFMLKKDGKWQLAPAYDLCHAYRPNSMWVSQHALSVNGKRTDEVGYLINNRTYVRAGYVAGLVGVQVTGHGDYINVQK